MKLELIQAVGRASEGQKIGWFGNRWHEVDDDFQAADHLCQGASCTITRASGRQRIDFPNGGRIHFLSGDRSHRGVSLDRAYMPGDAPDHVLQDVLPALGTSKDGAIVYHWRTDTTGSSGQHYAGTQ